MSTPAIAEDRLLTIQIPAEEVPALRRELLADAPPEGDPEPETREDVDELARKSRRLQGKARRARLGKDADASLALPSSKWESIARDLLDYAADRMRYNAEAPLQEALERFPLVTLAKRIVDAIGGER